MTILHFQRTRVAAVAVAAGLTLAACGGNDSTGGGEGESISGPVVIDGSSTVEPLSSAAAELFMGEHPDANVTVGTSGTGGGFEKFCAGETDISDASRPIKDSEIAVCQSNNIQYSPLVVANDALSVVVNNDNTWTDCLTVAQLNKIWAPGSTVNNWNQVDPSFPDEPLQLFGAGSDSGTFDYFTQAVNGTEGESRTDYNPTEDDNITVQGVSATKGALGYFGYSYLEANADKVKGVKIDSGGGCIAPSTQTAQDGTYKPLSRELFIYVSDAALKKPQVVAFADFYLGSNQEIVEAAKFIPLTPAQLQVAQAELDALNAKAGN
ncbi:MULTISPECIES: PstS family phosphate ABC transporter substrate-binding protein [Rhodococcus]|uniref:Phosphate-binding protein n=2 Tax=Rhodococcus opacus TaxID=37919 RepID=C1BCA2_RHOOB|nr:MULTISPECIES: PstS family phosphate ABC transporter substrate-binding protein [Rhodococcus]EID79090.1 putative phosphate ABC transporter phosphate-binding protein [Rhodococcus opacus RKJ300 = JCM 13270]KAF0966665.1 Protein SphX [Rhodococcus sp. T7]QQZ18330.1 PstS family phosphate ABC transporter substrate-binding protein [Rhodococcus sp. 21391]BAH55957.1 putative phosphate ABC transporter phosphate-binding protein [Rhodococcus opacus B4]